jgi:hypothetical protein
VLLLRECHIVAIGIVLVVVGFVGQRVRDGIRLSAVCHSLIRISRLNGFVVVRMRVRRGVSLVVWVMLIVCRARRRVIRGREAGGRGIRLARAVLAMCRGGGN